MTASRALPIWCSSSEGTSWRIISGSGWGYIGSYKAHDHALDVCSALQRRFVRTFSFLLKSCSCTSTAAVAAALSAVRLYLSISLNKPIKKAEER